MGLAPELESQLREARLEGFIPVLSELGVEAIADLEFVQDSDFESIENVTTLQKRRFFDWKKKTLEDQETRTAPRAAPLETPDLSKSEQSKNLSKSTKLATVTSNPEALRPPGFEPRDPALDVDFHKIFSDPNLSADDVKSLFRDLCKKHHPDKGGNADVFSRINKAYNVVMDPLESYLGAEAVPPPPSSAQPMAAPATGGYPETKKEEKEAVVPVPPPEDTPEDTGNAEDKSATHVDEPLVPALVPNRRSFRDSMGMCFTSSRQ